MTTPAFHSNLSQAERTHQRLLQLYYPRFAAEIADVQAGNALAIWLQTVAHVDTIIVTRDRNMVTYEEKCVNKLWTDIVIEELSSINPRRPGWIETCAADRLLWVFPDGTDLICYDIPMGALRAWWNESGMWRQYESRQIPNKTEWGQSYCSLVYKVPINVLRNEIAGITMTILKDGAP